jgi:signal transduction histidine kinase
MLPLALLAGMALALVPPLAYRQLAQQRLRAQAGLHAEELARIVRRTAERQPYLWRYGVAKRLRTAVHRQEGHRLRLAEVRACDGTLVVDGSRLGLRANPGPVGPLGFAPVVTRGVQVARVGVRLDAADEQRTFFGFSIVFLSLGTVVGLLLYLFPTRVVGRQAGELAGELVSLEEAERELRTKNRELAARVEAALGELRHLSGRVLSVQEEERRRLARDLHDSVGQLLTGLRLELELLATRPDRLDDAVRTAGRAVEELRTVVHDLRPPELEGQTLAQALRAETERFEGRTGVVAVFREQPPPQPGVALPELPEVLGTAVYRLLQEALHNVARHAGAREVVVTLRLPTGPGGVVGLIVADDGRGFDPSAVERGRGLSGMAERCAFFGGRLEVESTIGGGVQVRAELPVPPTTS